MRRKNLSYHLMLLPAALLVFVFNYLPLGGIVIAFQDFDYLEGIAGFWLSPWVGFKHFQELFASGGEGLRIIRNTLSISAIKIILGVLFPVFVSILLNEIKGRYGKRAIQTIIYIPHFISWIIFAGIIKQLLLDQGTLNALLSQVLHKESVPFLTSNDFFVPTIIVTDLWKSFGFGTVVYLATISNIDPGLYESALIDGAKRLQQTLYITLPCMVPIIVLMLVLSLQNVLNAGFDQIFNLYSVPVYEVGDILDTYIYRISFNSQIPDYSLSAAVGLFKSLVSAVLIIASHHIAYKLTNYRVF